MKRPKYSRYVLTFVIFEPVEQFVKLRVVKKLYYCSLQSFLLVKMLAFLILCNSRMIILTTVTVIYLVTANKTRNIELRGHGHIMKQQARENRSIWQIFCGKKTPEQW